MDAEAGVKCSQNNLNHSAVSSLSDRWRNCSFISSSSFFRRRFSCHSYTEEVSPTPNAMPSIKEPSAMSNSQLNKGLSYKSAQALKKKSLFIIGKYIDNVGEVR